MSCVKEQTMHTADSNSIQCFSSDKASNQEEKPHLASFDSRSFIYIFIAHQNTSLFFPYTLFFPTSQPIIIVIIVSTSQELSSIRRFSNTEMNDVTLRETGSNWTSAHVDALRVHRFDDIPAEVFPEIYSER